jgi:hypothetical protein
MHKEKQTAIRQGPLGVSGMEASHNGIGMDPVLKVRSLGPDASSGLRVEARRADDTFANVLARHPPVCKGLDVI